jgi:Golgi apyrase
LVLEENPNAFEKRIQPGLSSLATAETANVDEYMRPLIEFAKSSVPPSLHHKTSFYLMATAGMRLISRDQQHSILSSVCDAVRQQSHFILSSCEEQVSVISGADEGLYGWIAVNYLMKRLQPGSVQLFIIIYFNHLILLNYFYYF